MRVKITIQASVTDCTNYQQLNDRIARQLEKITDKDRCDSGITKVHSVSTEQELRPSAIAEKWRVKPCTLDGEAAVIKGWDNQFAKIWSLESDKECEFAWATVNRIMENGGRFKT